MINTWKRRHQPSRTSSEIKAHDTHNAVGSNIMFEGHRDGLLYALMQEEIPSSVTQI